MVEPKPGTLEHKLAGLIAAAAKLEVFIHSSWNGKTAAQVHDECMRLASDVAWWSRMYQDAQAEQVADPRRGFSGSTTTQDTT